MVSKEQSEYRLLESLLAAGDEIANNDEILLLSFMVMQAWGQKPKP